MSIQFLSRILFKDNKLIQPSIPKVQHLNILQKKGLSTRISKITGKWQYYLPIKQKLQFYFISIGTCLLLALGSIIFMVLSLNARGFVDPDHKLLYFESISSWASKGGIFDAQTWWGQVPNLVHVIVTNAFDQNVYRPLAKKLTKIQRHLNSKSHSNSIITKFFIYEFIITFADFFYIAFVRFDIEGLREQLLSLFFIDIIRRVVAQSLIPRLKNKYLSYSLKDKNVQIMTPEQQLRHYAILQVSKQNFQSFDDYLQIITNFAYLVMISSCFPLAPLLIIMAHSVQIFNDKYKLIHIYRRKLPQKFVGMGYWKDIIVFICYMSIVTNILLFAFSSQQIVSIFPQIFESGKDLVLGNIDFTTLLGGAATGVFSAMMTLGNNTIQTMSDTLDIFSAQNNTFTNYTDPMLLNNGWGPDNGTQLNQFWMNPTDSLNNGTMFPFLKSHPIVPKQHQVQFIGILFLLEHIFLIGFIALRSFLVKRKTIADIFLERRTYKRKVKKYLSKDVLTSKFRDQVVTKVLGYQSQQGNKQYNNSNNSDFLSKLLGSINSQKNQLQKSISSTEISSSRSSVSSSQGDFFTNIIETLASKAQDVIGVNYQDRRQQKLDQQDKKQIQKEKKNQ